MGWCSGSIIAEELWNDIRKYIPKEKEKIVAEKIFHIFDDNDADCWDDDMNLIRDAKIKLDEW